MNPELVAEIHRLRRLLQRANTRAWEQRVRAELWKKRALAKARFQR